jgi:hypothetical protein
MKLGIIITTIAVLCVSACEKRDTPPAGVDWALREKLGVHTIGGRFQIPANAKTAAAIVRYFDRGTQVDRGPLIWFPIRERGILECEILVQGKDALIYTPNCSATDHDDFYETTPSQPWRFRSGRLTSLPDRKDVYLLGYISSGVRGADGVVIGNPSFDFHLRNAEHVIALFVMTSDLERPDALHLQLEHQDFGVEPGKDGKQAVHADRVGCALTFVPKNPRLRNARDFH